jgi:hypothetical protein
MGVIYESKKYDPENKDYGISAYPNFIPVFSGTDHFHFACPKCKEVARILWVNLSEIHPCKPIYFLLECPKCGNHSIRKIYLEEEGRDIHMLYPSKTVWLNETKKANEH